MHLTAQNFNALYVKTSQSLYHVDVFDLLKRVSNQHWYGLFISDVNIAANDTWIVDGSSCKFAFLVKTLCLVMNWDRRPFKRFMLRNSWRWFRFLCVKEVFSFKNEASSVWCFLRTLVLSQFSVNCSLKTKLFVRKTKHLEQNSRLNCI